jgi:integrase
VNQAWAATLRGAKVPHFSLYELRHTFATRLSAGGVADHFVAQALRQDDSAVFKRYSQAKLRMLREALGRSTDKQTSTARVLDHQPGTDRLLEQLWNS